MVGVLCVCFRMPANLYATTSQLFIIYVPLACPRSGHLVILPCSLATFASVTMFLLLACTLPATHPDLLVLCSLVALHSRCRFFSTALSNYCKKFLATAFLWRRYFSEITTPSLLTVYLTSDCLHAVFVFFVLPRQVFPFSPSIL